jgi:hypothetical protein
MDGIYGRNGEAVEYADVYNDLDDEL